MNSAKIISKISYILFFHSSSSSKSASHNFLHLHSRLALERSNPGQAVSWATQRLQITKTPGFPPVPSGTCGLIISQSADCTSTR